MIKKLLLHTGIAIGFVIALFVISAIINRASILILVAFAGAIWVLTKQWNTPKKSRWYALLWIMAIYAVLHVIPWFECDVYASVGEQQSCTCIGAKMYPVILNFGYNEYQCLGIPTNKQCFTFNKENTSEAPVAIPCG